MGGQEQQPPLCCPSLEARGKRAREVANISLSEAAPFPNDSNEYTTEAVANFKRVGLGGGSRHRGCRSVSVPPRYFWVLYRGRLCTP